MKPTEIKRFKKETGSNLLRYEKNEENECRRKNESSPFTTEELLPSFNLFTFEILPSIWCPSFRKNVYLANSSQDR